MRVLHLIGVMGAGGAESLVAEMVRRGPDVGWISGIASGGGVQQDELIGRFPVSIYSVPAARRRPTGVARAVGRTVTVLLDFRPDVIIAHNVGVSLVGGVARRIAGRGRRGVPMISVFHGVAAEDYRASARILSRTSDLVVTVSQAILDRLRGDGLTSEAVVIPNAITVTPNRSREEVRAELGVQDEPLALCLARMVDQKRHDVLLDAWSSVRAPARLFLAGQGELRPALEEQARRLGLTDRVTFLGVRRDVPDLLEAADITVLSSDWEGLPIAILESMAAGVPPVVTDVDGNAEAIGPEAGRLVPPRDPPALAAALEAMLYDEPVRRAAGEACKRRVAERHDPTVLMHSYDAILRGLSGKSGRGLLRPSAS